MCPTIASAAASPAAATAAAPAAAPSAAPAGPATFEELWLGSASLDIGLPLVRRLGFVTRMQESARVAVATVAAVLEVPAHLRAAVGGVDGGLTVLKAAVVAPLAVAVAKGEAMIWFIVATRALGLITMQEVAIVAELALSS